MPKLSRVGVDTPTDIAAAIQELRGGVTSSVPLVSDQYVDSLPLGGHARDDAAAPRPGDIDWAGVNAAPAMNIHNMKQMLRAEQQTPGKELAMRDARIAKQAAGEAPLDLGYGEDAEEGTAPELPTEYIDLTTGAAIWQGTPLTLNKAELASMNRLMHTVARRAIRDEISSLRQLAVQLSGRKRKSVRKAARKPRTPVPTPPPAEPTPPAAPTRKPRGRKSASVPTVPAPNDPA